MQSSNEQLSLNSTPKCFPQDFPPLPKCFHHLLSNGNESSLEEQANAPFVVDNIVGLNMPGNISNGGSNVTVIDQRIGAKSSARFPVEPVSHYSMQDDSSASTENTISEFPPFPFISPQAANSGSPLKIVQGKDSNEKGHLGKLSSSLNELKRKMTDLRTLDVNLFFQLLSLHEAIQDFKMTVGERFSETASEYSLGSASYMGSMSSLSEEDTDWLESLQHSHSSGKGLEDSQVFVDNQSASSLLDQITALVQRADADF